jgi:hypothetical protein
MRCGTPGTRGHATTKSPIALSSGHPCTSLVTAVCGLLVPCTVGEISPLVHQSVAVVRDATAAARLTEGDGCLAAIINFRYLADALWTTDEAVRRISG